jgi:hypothetical protein
MTNGSPKARRISASRNGQTFPLLAEECWWTLKDSAPNDHGMMHQQLLAKLGMPLGELWRLGPLARHMRSAGRWDAFITIKPLNITGGTGSHANATALI